MTSTSSRLMVEHWDDVIVVRFVDRDILDAASIDRIGAELDQLADSATHPRMVISFRNVEHLSSAAISMLLTLRTKIEAEGGQLQLSSIGSELKKVFEITRLNKLFKMHKSAAIAAQAMK